MKVIAGGVTAAKGFEAAATAAQIKYKDRTDMAMVYSQVPCVCAGTFTTNVVKAACVKWDKQIVESGKKAQVVIVNSGEIEDNGETYTEEKINKTKDGETISKDKLREIAETKMPDLNAASIEAAMSMIAGTARSMGITVED